MRFPLSWLSEWARVPASVDEISRRLTARGFSVEGTVQIGHEYPNVVVGHVLEVAPHPDADKLTLCKVDAGGGQILAVVCGAPNVRPGMKVPLALVGAELPGGLKIKRSKIRGEMSEGMLCSARELELGGDHSGILALRDDAPIGHPVREVFGEPDVVLEVEVAYNRPDALCMAGMGRELAAAFELREAGGPWQRFRATVATGGTFPVRVEDPEACPRYLAQVIRGVTIAPSPAWLQERLERAGMRPIHNVVDVTNYVLLELGHPLHAFDLAALDGSEIVVRRARAGERITTLDGKDRALTPEHLVIADRTRPTVIAGVMGAAHVEVHEGTQDVLLEAAWFDPVRIQRAVSDHGILSEAARRYGRGVDPALAPAAMARALELLLDIAGGTLDGPATDAKAKSFDPLELELQPAHVARLLGVKIGRDRIARDLGALGFGIVDPASGGEASEVPMVVTVPTRRRDVTRAVDLIEEVARAFGYDRLPDVPPVSGGAVGDRPPERRLRDQARAALIGLGFSECMTATLDDPERLASTWPLLNDGTPRLALIRNAAGPETSALRSDLVSGLLRVAGHNVRHGAPGLRLFEIGRVFAARGPSDRPAETTQVVAVVTGARFEEAWDTAQAEVDFFEAKGLWEAFLTRLGVDRTDWAPYSAPGWKSGEAAELRAKVRVACAGRVSPLLARRFDLEAPLYLFAADLDALGRARRETTRFTDFPRLPAVRRDVAFFLPADVPHGRIESLLRKSGGSLLSDVRLFDVYVGPGVPQGQKSLAYALTFQAADRTLQESEIESIQRTMVETLSTAVGAVLRDR